LFGDLRDMSAEHSGLRFGVTDPATQLAFLQQFDTQLQQAVSTVGQGKGFAATRFFQALPPAGRFPLACLDTTAFTQTFFPQQVDVRLSMVPQDELGGLMKTTSPCRQAISPCRRARRVSSRSSRSCRCRAAATPRWPPACQPFP
jgi:hypothetical protein